MLPADLHDPRIELCEASICITKLVEKFLEQLAPETRQASLFDRCRGLGREAPGSLRQDDAIFGKEAAGVIDERRALDDQPLANPMQRLQILLIRRFDRNVAHRRACRRLVNGFRVDGVVLRAPHEGLYETRIDQPDLSPGRRE